MIETFGTRLDIHHFPSDIFPVVRLDAFPGNKVNPVPENFFKLIGKVEKFPSYIPIEFHQDINIAAFPLIPPRIRAE